jgi:hypothetical protein
MGYWTDKCFGCYVVGVLSLIAFMSIKEIRYENRKKQIKQKYEKNATNTNIVADSTNLN